MASRQPNNFKKVLHRPEMVSHRSINFKKVFRQPEMVSHQPFNLKKVSHRPEMVSHRPSSKKRFAIDRFWLPVVQKRFSVPKTTFFDLVVTASGIFR